MADRLLKLLPGRGFVAKGFTELAAATAWANQCHADGRLRALVGMGGDGTAAELINRTAEGVPLTLLPAGNSNLLARHFGLRNDPQFVCRTIAEGVLARFDAGRANGRLFSLMAGCGFDAEVVRRVHQRRRGHLRQWAYFGSALRAIASYPFPEIRVHWEEEDGGGEPLSARWLFAFNLPCYGGGFRIAPESDGSDGLLDVCAFGRGHLWHTLKLAAAVLLGRHQRLADWTWRRVRRSRLTSDGQVPYQLDGDPAGLLPLDLEVLPGRVTLVVPNGAVVEKRTMKNEGRGMKDEFGKA
jgi:diacylglycerol kinase family enzyme